MSVNRLPGSVEIPAEDSLRILYALTCVIAETHDLDRGLHQALGVLCSETGWTLGEVWVPDYTERTLERLTQWSSDQRTETFVEESNSLRFRRGVGLPGRTWAQGEVVWMKDLDNEPEFMRKEGAAILGLHTGVGIPFLAGQKVVGVMTFFLRELRNRDTEFVQFLSSAAAQIGVLVQRRRLEELTRSNQDLEQFAQVVSHDLKEPLRAITSYLELISRRHAETLDDESGEFLQLAMEGSSRMRALLDDLLAYSRVGRKVVRVPVPLNEAVTSAKKNLAEYLQEAGAEVSITQEVPVPADPSLLTLVFQNLIENAVKFRGTEPPRIEIGGWNLGQEVLVAVRDNGQGIAEIHHGRIFQIFKRLDPAKAPGTGIGLPVCRRVMDAHDGRIWVDSEEGRGATFWLAFPVE